MTVIVVQDHAGEIVAVCSDRDGARRMAAKRTGLVWTEHRVRARK